MSMVKSDVRVLEHGVLGGKLLGLGVYIELKYFELFLSISVTCMKAAFLSSDLHFHHLFFHTNFDVILCWCPFFVRVSTTWFIIICALNEIWYTLFLILPVWKLICRNFSPTTVKSYNLTYLCTETQKHLKYSTNWPYCTCAKSETWFDHRKS